MNLKALFKLQTAVVLVVSTLLLITLIPLVPDTSFAQNGTAPVFTAEMAAGLHRKSPCERDPSSEECTIEKETARERLDELRDRKSSRRNQTCSDALRDFGRDQKEFKSSCSGSPESCLKKAQACNDDVTERGIGQMAAMAFDPTGCANALTSTKCPELNAGSTKNAKEEKKDLEEKKKDSKKKLEDLMEDSQSLTAKSEKSLQDLKETMEDSEKSLRDTQLKVTDQIAAMKSALNDEKMKAYQEARAAYAKIDEEYLKMRDQVRRDTSAVAAAKADIQRVCRTYAMQKYSEADQQLKQRIAIAEGTPKNQGSMTTAAGTTKRTAKQAEKQRSLNYAGHFKDCLNGVAPEGTAALNKIADLENTQKDNQAMLVDKAALLEKQRAEVVQRVQELEQSAAEKEASATQQAQQQLQNLQSDYMKLQQRNQEKFALAQQQLAREQHLLAQKMTTENQELQKLDSEIMLAQTKVMCTQSSGGQMSESSGDRKIDRINKAMEALSALQSSCLMVSSACTNASAEYKTQADGAKRACESYSDLEDDEPVSSRPSSRSGRSSTTRGGK